MLLPRRAPVPSPSQRMGSPPRITRWAPTLGSFVVLCAFVTCLYFAGREAYKIRLYAIKTYGRVIHEFDPWFNFRATKYLADNGWAKFLSLIHI